MARGETQDNRGIVVRLRADEIVQQLLNDRVPLFLEQLQSMLLISCQEHQIYFLMLQILHSQLHMVKFLLYELYMLLIY